MIINDFKNVFIFTLASLITFSVAVILLENYPFLGFFLSLMIFGRLQIYYSEVLHEATHFNFFRSFRLNNIISNVLLYPFLLITVEQNRKSHFIHHSFKEEGEEYFTSNDPETGIYSPNDFSLSNILKDLVGYTTIKIFLTKSLSKHKNKTNVLPFILYNLYALVFWFLIINFNTYGLKIFICWGISGLTIYSFLNRVRIYLMHKNFSGNENTSRDIKSDFLSNIFISKMMLNHKMHHKYPSLPYRELNKLTDEKMNPKDSCWGLIKSFVKNKNEMSIL